MSRRNYLTSQAATGILARTAAEAEGILAMNKALEGDGGNNMVMLEYARKLNTMKLLGKPFTVQGHVERRRLTCAEHRQRETRRDRESLRHCDRLD